MLLILVLSLKKTKYINTYRNQLYKLKSMVLLTVIKIEEGMLS
jgi:hypothetical protein